MRCCSAKTREGLWAVCWQPVEMEEKAAAGQHSGGCASRARTFGKADEGARHVEVAKDDFGDTSA